MNSLEEALEPVFQALDTVASKARTEPLRGELGTVLSLSEGTAKLSGLRGIGLEEVVRFEGGELGIALTLEPEEVGVVLLDRGDGIQAGSSVSRTGSALHVPVGQALLGRIIDGAGRPLDRRAGLPRGQGNRPLAPAAAMHAGGQQWTMIFRICGSRSG